MGVIARQSIKTTIANFAGAFIGMISILLIYPLQEDALGYAQFLYNAGAFLTPFAGLGLTVVAIKYFSEDNSGKQNSGFLFFLLAGVSIGFVLLLSLYIIFRIHVYALLDKAGIDSNIFRANEITVLILTWLITMITLITNFISNYGRIAVPSLLHNVGYKLYLPLVILGVYLGYLNISGVGFAVILFHVLLLAGLFMYLKQLGGLDLRFNKFHFTKARLRPVSIFALYNALTIIGALLVYRIDIIMISGMLDYTQAGIYFMVMTMANVIEIPSQALNNITAPVISKSWNENDIVNIDKLYKKSSVNLLIAGGLLFLGIWFCFDDLAAISSKPEVFQGAKLIFLFLAGTKLVDLLTSVNNPIINYSAYYKYNLSFILGLGIINIFLNLYFIEKYHAVGAAIASFTAMGLFNLMKLVFIYLKFKMQPFTISMLKLFGIYILVFAVCWWIPFPSHPIIAILTKAVLITALYGSLVYFARISEDINVYADSYLLKIAGILKIWK